MAIPYRWDVWIRIFFLIIKKTVPGCKPPGGICGGAIWQEGGSGASKIWSGVRRSLSDEKKNAASHRLAAFYVSL